MFLVREFGGEWGWLLVEMYHQYGAYMLGVIVFLFLVHVASGLVAAERGLDFRGRFVQFRIVHVDVQLLGHLLGDLLQDLLFVLQGGAALGGQLTRQMAAERGLNTGGRIAQLCGEEM